jgi:hypothetical protein
VARCTRRRPGGIVSDSRCSLCPRRGLYRRSRYVRGCCQNGTGRVSHDDLLQQHRLVGKETTNKQTVTIQLLVAPVVDLYSKFVRGSPKECFLATNDGSHVVEAHRFPGRQLRHSGILQVQFRSSTGQLPTTAAVKSRRAATASHVVTGCKTSVIYRNIQ